MSRSWRCGRFNRCAGGTSGPGSSAVTHPSASGPQGSDFKGKLPEGETEFAPGPFAHVIKNVGDTPFRNVTIEILRPPSTQEK